MYELDAKATSKWDIGGEGSGSYDVSFEVTETVESTGRDGSVVTVEMKPLSVTENGLPSPGPDIRTFRLRLGPEGGVEEVLEVDGVAASELDPNELAFIGTYRPPLPEQPVRITETWQAVQELSVGSLLQQIETTGRLESLRAAEDSDLGRIAFNGEGPLVWTTELPQGVAELNGSAVTTIGGEFDITLGVLQSARSSVSGTFDVRIVPPTGEAPITGTLDLALKMTLEIKS